MKTLTIERSFTLCCYCSKSIDDVSDTFMSLKISFEIVKDEKKKPIGVNVKEMLYDRGAKIKERLSPNDKNTKILDRINTEIFKLIEKKIAKRGLFTNNYSVCFAYNKADRSVVTRFINLFIAAFDAQMIENRIESTQLTPTLSVTTNTTCSVTKTTGSVILPSRSQNNSRNFKQPSIIVHYKEVE